MRRWAMYVGWFLVVIGILSLISAIWKIDIWNYFWPAVLVALGIWILVKPAESAWWDWFGVFGKADGNYETIFSGTGKTREQSIFAGETNIDLAKIEIPEGGLNLKFNGFAGEVRIAVPPEVGVKVKAQYFAGEIQLFGEKMTGVMAPIENETPGFELASKKVYIEVNYFAGETLIYRSA